MGEGLVEEARESRAHLKVEGSKYDPLSYASAKFHSD